jgi:MoxR-like ATPase
VSDPTVPPPPGPPTSDDPRAAIARLRAEVAKVVVGQEGTVSGIVVALLSRGHVLLEGVPGTAKTLLVKTLAAALDLETRRVQFTPDLMPSDLIGQVVYRQAEGTFTFREGPVFTNLLLADEVNRTPPKTQAALLEAMEERQVTVEGTAHPLPEPFLVIATQNPIEYEGTYPLPEAQLDRFLFKLDVGYPSAAEEIDVLVRHDAGMDPHDIAAAGVRPVAGAADLAAGRAAVGRLRVEQPVLEYIVAVVRATRESPSLSLGVSPRGAASLLHAAKAWAWLSGRDFVTPDEVKAIAKPTLRHRLMVRPELELEGVTPDGVLDAVLATVPVPR